MLIGTVRAINDLTYWRVTVTNGPVPNTNVEVEFTIPTEFSISNSTLVPVGTLVGDTWTIGAMTPGQVYSADIILKFDGPVPGVAEEFEVEAVVTGTGDTNSSNNTKIDTINFEILSCDPFASGSNCSDGLKFDLSECSTPCTQGATPKWTVDEEASVNVEIISFDEDTGIGFYKYIDPSIQGTISWGLECILGEDTITVCTTYTLTLHPIIDDKAVFNHTADLVNGSTLSPAEIAILKAQPAYSAFTDEQIEGFCWEVLYNADGDLVGGWAHQCTGTQDNRSFIFCSETECDEIPEDTCPSCPYTDMPVDVSTYLGAIVDYTPQSGDNITVYHPGAISVYEYNGTAWVRSTCGCIQFLNNPYPVSFTITGGATKTATITLSDTTTLTTSFTDNDANTTYTMTLVNLLGINYVRLIDNSGNVVSSVMLPTSGGDCCCDCTFNLIPTQDGAIASTNCDITWTGPEANAIWEARPATGDEEDWVELDGGYHNGVYDNGAAGLYIRVRYTIDSCERFSNIVTPLVCPCWTQIVFTDVINSFRLERENCGSLNIDDFEWQVRISFGVWETIQTGGTSINYNTLSEDPEFPEVSIGPIVIRGKYTDPFGCVHFTDVQYITIP